MMMVDRSMHAGAAATAALRNMHVAAAAGLPPADTLPSPPLPRSSTATACVLPTTSAPRCVGLGWEEERRRWWWWQRLRSSSAQTADAATWACRRALQGGNRLVLRDQVRQAFKKNMDEADPERIDEQKEA